ncbi:MAG: threonine synthase [Gemmatimonadetes bacterium]|nr:threonine synthase [Gemmatimonadota bacterium]
MRFVSTRGRAPAVSLSEAIRSGLAPDGGLYMPNAWPTLAMAAVPPGLVATAQVILTALAGDDPLASLAGELCEDALRLDAPLVPVTDDGHLSVLELFHGPTAAFKDFGARFLAACLSRVPRTKPLEILVATSGDTGGAVAAAFHHRPGIRVTLLFPEGRVSPLQERQLTCWGGNVTSLAVRGTFDDCQRMVKEVLSSTHLVPGREVSSANSINIGRLLPQAAYYAAASLQVWRAHGERLSFIVPSGNLGNAFGAVAARAMGFPVGRILLACNANRTVAEFLATGSWSPRLSVKTIATAMDVGNPSNMERFRAMFPTLEEIRGAVTAVTVSDDRIRSRIEADVARFGRVWCPHTAVGAEAWASLPEELRRERWCLVATAHPAKFAEIVEPLVGGQVAVPPALKGLYQRPAQVTVIDAATSALLDSLNTQTG